MNIGYEILNVHNPNNGFTKPYYKLLFPANQNSILHRWKSPSYSVLHLQHCDHKEYFIQDKSSSAFINSIQTLSTLSSAKEITKYLFQNNIIQPHQLGMNYAFNLFDLHLSTVFEARIITCFLKYDQSNICCENIYWDLFIDHINIHIYVSTNILRRLMSSHYIGNIVSFHINHIKIRELSLTGIDIFIPRQSTIFLTINKATLEKRFKYDNNIIELQKPQITSTGLVFSSKPLHVGSGIQLSTQYKDFNTETNQHIMKLHKKKKNKIYQCRIMVICNKSELEYTVNHPGSKYHLNFISVSDQNSNSSKNQTNNVLDKNFHYQRKDDYVILLIASNPKKSIDTSKYPKFNLDDLENIHKLRNPNITSSNGKKHHKSYGKFFGFGIINKYKIDLGVSFGEFESFKPVKDNINPELITNTLKSQFNFFIDRINSVVMGCVEGGNDQINSIIHFGRMSCINQKFVEKTDASQCLIEKCFSIWLCKNARTEEFHQELDASYTLIGVPINYKCKNNISTSNYKFQFRWNIIDDNECEGIDVGLFEGMVLYYNGFGLFHRQVPCHAEYNNNSFWNMSMYHNYRLYNSISKSLNRYNTN